MIAAPLGPDLELAADGDRFTAEIPSRWATPHTFGGFTGALLLAALHERSSQPELLSANVSWMGRPIAGPVRGELTETRRGGSFFCGHATLLQDEAPVATVDAWFGPAGSLPEVEGRDDEPDGFEPEWLLDLFPFFRSYDWRAVDHATSASDVASEPSPEVCVWNRARPELGLRTPFARQLVTLMILDSSTFAPAVRPLSWAASWGAGHALSVHWTGMPADDGWYRLDAESLLRATPHVVCRGSLTGADGAPIASALTQGRVTAGRTGW